MKTAVRLSLISVALASCAATAPSNPDPESSRVVVFKDGHALIVRTFTAVTDEHGDVQLDDVPDAAVLGTFWATARQGDLVGMHAGYREVSTPQKREFVATMHHGLLKANRGRRVEVRYRDGATFTGKVQEVLGEGDEERGGMFVLRTADGVVVLSTKNIRSIVTDELVTSRTEEVTTTTRQKVLTLRFGEPNARRDITLTYFRPGLRWIPTYRFDLESAKKGKLTLQAEIINEAEDVSGLPIDVVVGVPNFRFKDAVSPLILEARMKQTLAAVAPTLMSQSQSFSNATYSAAPIEARTAAVAAVPSELAGSLQGDLFYFSLPAMQLAKGDRAAVRVFERSVPYRHVYTWDLQLKTGDEARTPAQIGSPLHIGKNEVWHQLELTNETDTVWTTGAVMVMSDGRPVSQELLTYTSRGDRGRVPLTISVETRGTADEVETGRQLDALTWERVHYAKVDRRATLSLCNHKPEAIDVEIRLELGGRATKASDEGAIVLGGYRAQDWYAYRGSQAVNNSSTVTWKRRLKPGETFEPTVDYHHYAQR